MSTPTTRRRGCSTGRPTPSTASSISPRTRPTSQSQIAIDPRTGGADLAHHPAPPHAVGVGLRPERLEGAGRTSRSTLGLRYEGFLNIFDAAGRHGEHPVRPRTATSRRSSPARRWSSASTTSRAACGAAACTRSRRARASPGIRRSEGEMSIRGGIGRSYERMSNQIWDGEYTNLPGVRHAHVHDLRDPVKPVFGLGKNTAGALRLSATVRADRRAQPVRRPAERARRRRRRRLRASSRCTWTTGSSACSDRSPHQIVVEGDYIGSRGRNAYFKWNINRFNGDLFDGGARSHPARIRRDQLHGLDRPELVPRRHGIGEGDAHRHQFRRVVHVRQGHRLLEHVLAAAAAGRLRPCGPGQGARRFRRAAEGVALGDLDDSGTRIRHR